MLLPILAVAIILIAIGKHDPQPFKQKRWSVALQDKTIPSGSRRIFWLDRTVPDGDFSLVLTAARRGGEADMAYGIVLGDDRRHMAVAVSPLGYVAIWHQNDTLSTSDQHSTSHTLPWQRWPHVKTDSAVNELWINVENGHIIVRVNRERLWDGEFAQLRGEIGVIGESFGEKATITFEDLSLFTN